MYERDLPVRCLSDITKRISPTSASNLILVHGLHQSGPVVIDNSSAWRMDPNVPLVIPEINLDSCKGKKLIANPNCTTAIALMALYPLHKEFGVKKCIMSTYQV